MAQRKTSSKSQIEEMSVEELIRLRDQVDNLLGERLSSEKRALQDKLSAIERYERGFRGEPTKEYRVREKHGRLAPKYRNPVSGETWAGRGQMPRWMSKLVKQGAKPEDFLIGNQERA